MSDHYVDKFKLSCKNCGGAMQTDANGNVAKCPYCKDTVVLAENENVTIARIELAQQELKMTKLKLNLEKKQEIRLDKTRKSFLTILVLIFTVTSVLAAAMGIATSHYVSASIALVQVGLFFSAWLIRMRFIKGAERKIHTLVTIIGLLFILPFIFCMDIQHRRYTEYTWPSSGLSELLPQPESKQGEMRSDNNTTFSIQVGKTSATEFDAYVEECKNRGFTYEQLRYNDFFSAYNDEGTSLRLTYTASTRELYIDLKALPEMKEYFWNTRGIAGMLPEPKSKLGFIDTESSTYFEILIGEVDRAEYSDYVAECIEKGFNIDIIDSNDYFSAGNADGYQVTVRREYFDIMSISVYVIN